MQQAAAPNAATAKFQLALPSLLAPISPHLAALHATRVRLLYPADSSLADTHCARCGAPFLATGGHTRSIRKKSRKSKDGVAATIRIIRRSCGACKHDDDVVLNAGTASAPAFPSIRERARRKSSTAPRVSTAATPAVSVAAQQQHALVSQQRASRSLPSSATPGSSRSSSIAPTPSRLAPTPASSSSSPGKTSGSFAKTPESQAPAQAKARPKQKTGLQTLLARNREKQKQEDKKRDRQGLSAFLQGL
ncbi:uncharacterized protein TRAVEDRAFT_70191 [Trametes versicolor FP-101664 SS1]|uniref:uncharacterized protein n=1 Tax=Trametes versicolor (strain FP-101664) TaxID=717944 RepID=UPI000462288C|nr:uncharacterized protein TRAVEDRAFT_70191 [Trametes versicolor FP-101664 SS1]EIW61961.1 hypothetical protein TRAVEDRAFT_70191 [Trametes versicolor FP-101664 SS1]